jgi:hypothetical protein
MTAQAREVVQSYRTHLARYQALQEIPGSTWTDGTVAEWMAPHRADAEHALYRLGLTRDQVAGLLADPQPEPRPARSASEYLNALLRGDRA